MQRTYRLRMYLTDAQEDVLAQWFGHARLVWRIEGKASEHPVTRRSPEYGGEGVSSAVAVPARIVNRAPWTLSGTA